MPEFSMGLDPGQSSDPTAIAIVHGLPALTEAERLELIMAKEPVPQRPVFVCDHLQRLPLRTSYVDVVSHAKRLIEREPLRGHCELVLDLTGVGRPVMDLFRERRLFPIGVTITAGFEEVEAGDNCWTVPKLLLVSQVQSWLHAGRLKVAADLPEAPALRAELEDFRAQATDTGRWRFGAREGRHDDLVLALALACWHAARPGMLRISDAMLERARASRRTRLGVW